MASINPNNYLVFRTAPVSTASWAMGIHYSGSLPPSLTAWAGAVCLTVVA